MLHEFIYDVILNKNMFKIEKKELRNLRKNRRKIIKKIKFQNGINPARNWYIYKDPFIQAFNYVIMSICKIFPPCELKNHLYRLIGAKIGKNVSIANDVIFDTLFPELIVIEDNVIVGWGTKLYTHEFTQKTTRIGSIILKKNSMIGEWSVVRPGITIGENSLISAMSFINEDVESNTLEGGIPIHIIKHLKNKKFGHT